MKLYRVNFFELPENYARGGKASGALKLIVTVGLFAKSDEHAIVKAQGIAKINYACAAQPVILPEVS